MYISHSITDIAKGRISRPPHCWHYGPDNFLLFQGGGRHYPVYSRMFSIIPGMFSNIYSLDAMELTLLVMTIKDVYTGLPWWSSG